ncbi:MAG: ParB/RepB/Spo0J family partition protein [Bacillota bacterium]
MKKSGLGHKGKGIEALINTKLGDIQETNHGNDTKNRVLNIDISLVEPNRKQPRKQFDEESLVGLADSLQQYGMLQPMIVKKTDDYYELIAGERRWRAAKIAGLSKVPVIEKSVETMEAFQMALVENVQREDLNCVEEAESYHRLKEEFNLSQEKIAEKIGKSRSSVANSLRLLGLCPEVLDFLRSDQISEGHGRTLLGLSDKEPQIELATRIIKEGLSVRVVEDLVKKYNSGMPSTDETDRDYFNISKTQQKAIENQLHSVFSTKVSLKQGKNKGKIEISYFSEEELDRIIGLINTMEGTS